MNIVDVSPVRSATAIQLPGNFQSVSGKALCVACSRDGMRVYLGGHSGVWRSDDGGATWRHPEHPQPPPGQMAVPGALPVTTIYDVAVSPMNPDIALASAGRDARVPPASGIYLSTDGAANWTLVHQFPPPLSGRVFPSQISFAPDDPLRVYAAGGTAVGISTDGGVTWTESKPPMTPSDRIWHVVSGPREGTVRRVYAAGSKFWFSLDGGLTWTADPNGKPLGAPADGPGTSARALAIHPSKPRTVYLISERVPWRAEFHVAGPATWTQLASLPVPPPGETTPSGADYIIAHVSPQQGIFHLIASDRETSQIASVDPAEPAHWRRMDGGNVHLDPHGVAVAQDFQTAGIDLPPRGRIHVVNDGGAYFSIDGGFTWTPGSGLSTLGIVNAGVCAIAGREPAICIGMGDNSGFFSADGGAGWVTQDYVGGDNDCCFADLRQPERLIVFAPRDEPDKIYLYIAPAGQRANGGFGTDQRHKIPGPPPIPPSGNAAWNCVSNFYNDGYRPLVMTRRDETPPADTDLVLIRFAPGAAFLMRSTKLSQVTDPADWLSTATADGPGVRAFQVGPQLPPGIQVVQASGGHASPVFYVGDPFGSKRLFKWSAGMAAWRQLVPGPLVNGVQTPAIARRFFVDPYRPSLIYVVDTDRVMRSDDGGSHWTHDVNLQSAVSQNGTFPFDAPFDGNPGQALIRDMVFDPDNPGYRYAAAPSGVFHTLDGIHWSHLLLSSASAMRPNNLAYDPVSSLCGRALYVATSNRGLLRLHPLPPDWAFPIGSLVNTSGLVTFLRVHDVGTAFGPPHDRIDAEAIFKLDSEPEKAFGFQLRTDDNELAHKGMLGLLRHGYRTRKRVSIDFIRHSCRTGRVLRVLLT